MWGSRTRPQKPVDRNPAQGFTTYLLIGALIFVYAVSMLGYAAFQSLDDARIKREAEIQRGVELMSLSLSLDRALGYGGFIHHFKNAVIRVDERESYLDATEDSLKVYRENLSNLIALAPQFEGSIDEVRRTIAEYNEGVQFMRQNLRLPTAETDRVVRVNDDAAIRDLTLLVQNLVNAERQAFLNASSIPREVIYEILVIVVLFIICLLSILVFLNRFRVSFERFRVLSQNAQGVAAIADSALIAIALIDNEGRLVYRNAAARRMLPGVFETLGSVPAEKFEPKEETDVLYQALRGKWVRSVLYEYQDEGAVKYLSVESGENLNFGAERVFKVAIRDFTDIAIADKINSRNQGLSTLGNVAGGIAHDFRNAVGAAKMSIESALRQETLEKAKPILLNAQEALQVGQDLARRLLDFADHRRSSVELTNINDALREASMMARLYLDDPAILTCDFGKSAPLVMANRNLLTNAIFNLILNASEAQKDARVASPEIKIWLEETETYFGQPAWAVLCQDNGPGFTSEALSNWRELFFTTKAQGTGVGLTIVKSLVDENAGFMTVQNVEGRGALVSIVLAQPINEVIGSDPNVENVDVVFVEDDEFLFKTLMQGLVNAGHSVRGFQSADTAMEFLEHHQFKLLLTDLDMPGVLNGHDLVRWSKLNRPESCVIVHSRLESGNIPYVKQLGAIFVQKGTNRTQLEAAIRDCLSGARA